MKRDDWTVQYTGQQLLDAAIAKHKFHGERRAWWQDMKDSTIKKIKSGGVEVNESIVDELMKGGYTTQAVNSGPVVRIDPLLQQHLREAHQKVHEHAGKIVEYDVWLQMLARHISKTFELDNDDWMFFFGHTKPTEQ